MCLGRGRPTAEANIEVLCATGAGGAAPKAAAAAAPANSTELLDLDSALGEVPSSVPSSVPERDAGPVGPNGVVLTGSGAGCRAPLLAAAGAAALVAAALLA